MFCKRGRELKHLEHALWVKSNYLKETLTEDFIESVWKDDYITWHRTEDEPNGLEGKKRLKEWEEIWKSDETQERVVEMLDRFNNNILAVA